MDVPGSTIRQVLKHLFQNELKVRVDIDTKQGMGFWDFTRFRITAALQKIYGPISNDE